MFSSFLDSPNQVSEDVKLQFNDVAFSLICNAQRYYYLISHRQGGRSVCVRAVVLLRVLSCAGGLLLFVLSFLIHSLYTTQTFPCFHQNKRRKGLGEISWTACNTRPRPEEMF